MYIDRTDLRRACASWIASPANRYHLTITFAWGTSPAAAEGLLNRLLTHLNRRIYKQRYADGLSFISGFAVRESSPLQDSVHYHIVIRDEGKTLPDYERLRALIAKQVMQFKGRNRERLGERRKRHIDEYMLQDYWNDGTGGLETYVTKELMNFNKPIDDALGAIGVLSAGKVQFGGELLKAKWFA